MSSANASQSSLLTTNPNHVASNTEQHVYSILRCASRTSLEPVNMHFPRSEREIPASGRYSRHGWWRYGSAGCYTTSRLAIV
jgi:hypothetical protein